MIVGIELSVAGRSRLDHNVDSPHFHAAVLHDGLVIEVPTQSARRDPIDEMAGDSDVSMLPFPVVCRVDKLQTFVFSTRNVFTTHISN